MYFHYVLHIANKSLKYNELHTVDKQMYKEYLHAQLTSHDINGA